MRHSVVLCAVLIFSYPVLAQKGRSAPPAPTEFEIGRRTFFDFGPPFNYYEFLVVRPVAEGTSVERIMLTPPGIKCVVLAKVEIATASLKESVASLLQKNPCAIPEKELRRERKRCKMKVARFSAMLKFLNILMRETMAGWKRLICAGTGTSWRRPSMR
jgi:hypothetical protein